LTKSQRMEIEVKIKIENIEKLKDKLAELGATLIKERYQEENTLYDSSSKSLYKRRCALRLRFENKKTFLTFKGPPLKSRKFKIRQEYETEVKNRKQCKKILKELGFIPTFRYNKHRTVYKKKNLEICLDETSIGNFMELEGERQDIVRFARSLNFSKEDFIKLDYIQLISRRRKNF
jgi:predicted adenylyl cyclase CyaB